jgi:hypothetical protein
VVRTIINNFTFDGATKDPVHKAVRDSLIAFMAATAQVQAEATTSYTPGQRPGWLISAASRHFPGSNSNRIQNLLAAGTTNASQIAESVGL